MPWRAHPTMVVLRLKPWLGHAKTEVRSAFMEKNELSGHKPKNEGDVRDSVQYSLRLGETEVLNAYL